MKEEENIARNRELEDIWDFLDNLEPKIVKILFDDNSRT